MDAELPLPPRRWDLSAPESGVLLWGPETRAAEALKLALLELVVRQALRLVKVKQRQLFVFSKHVNVLVTSTSLDWPAGRALRAVLEVAPPTRTYPDGVFGAPVEHWARAVYARYRQRGGYVQAEVLPALEARGLFQREGYRRLGLFQASRWVLTPTGTEALTELRSLMERGRAAFGPGMVPDQVRVRELFATAGAAVLLLPGLFPEIQVLRKQGSEGTTDGGLVVTVSGDGDGRPDDAAPGDPAPGDPAGDPFDLDALAGVFGPGPFDGLDSAFDAIDAGVDSGGGDGGDGDGE